MKHRKLAALIAATTLFAPLLSCADGQQQEEIKVYTGLFCALKDEHIPETNACMQAIAEKTGARCEETWLSEKDAEENVVSSMMMTSEYPDYLYPSSITMQKLLAAGAFIPIDEYWEEYPNIRDYYTAEEWNRVRSEDGHIYYIPAFSKIYMRDTNTIHSDEAFWVQVKVLKWAGYPEIVTLDDYFDLLEDYVAANPTGENGEPNIAYEILADETIFWPLDNPPMFLAGSPNDGACIVDPDTHEVIDYNTTDIARRWFQKLNEEYHKGIIDEECFVLSSSQYFDKIKTGNVLGMVDQRWNFGHATVDLPDECEYVPLGVVMDEGIEEHYHSQLAFDPSSGIGVTTSCADVDGALKFINDLLDPEIHRLRFWGIEGKDYSVGEDGVFYLTEEQKEHLNDSEYLNANRCLYSYFPYYNGMDRDGINAYQASYQPQEFYETLSPIMKECFDAYGARTYVELLNEAGENEPWYPMWSYTNTFTDETPEGRAKSDIDQTKFRYMPSLVMSDDFDAAWDAYMEAYEKNCDVDTYLAALEQYVQDSLGDD